MNANANTIWAQGLSAKRYSVADSVEGNGRNILVANAIPFGSAKDPRLPVIDTKRASQDGQTFTRTTTLYDRFTSIDVVNGIDARLIEAEAALAAGNTPGCSRSSTPCAPIRRSSASSSQGRSQHWRIRGPTPHA